MAIRLKKRATNRTILQGSTIQLPTVSSRGISTKENAKTAKSAVERMVTFLEWAIISSDARKSLIHVIK